MLASFVDEPARVTPAQMDRWCRDFDNWAICDTVCFHLFDRTPHAWRKVDAVEPAARRVREARGLRAAGQPRPARQGHAGTSRSCARSRSIERAAADERNFVKKGVSWALRAVGRRNRALNAAAVALARRLAESPEGAARWVGKDALREFAKVAARRR